LPYPALVHYQTELEYRQHFEQVYCRDTIQTFDGIQVRFRKDMFDHCFFESVVSKDDTFSPQRAERVDWIKAALQDNTAELREGWDNKKKQPAKDRRVAIVVGNYVVIIRIRGNKADFVTAFLAIGRSIRLIRQNPIWG
tara:strand:- start:134533 stop:134949 length:417 start_codon:yes stop_codon:yes gene_type:complete